MLPLTSHRWFPWRYGSCFHLIVFCYLFLSIASFQNGLRSPTCRQAGANHIHFHFVSTISTTSTSTALFVAGGSGTGPGPVPFIDKIKENFFPTRATQDYVEELTEEDLQREFLDTKPWRASKVKYLTYQYRPWKESYKEKFQGALRYQHSLHSSCLWNRSFYIYFFFVHTSLLIYKYIHTTLKLALILAPALTLTLTLKGAPADSDTIYLYGIPSSRPKVPPCPDRFFPRFVPAFVLVTD